MLGIYYPLGAIILSCNSVQIHSILSNFQLETFTVCFIYLWIATSYLSFWGILASGVAIPLSVIISPSTEFVTLSPNRR